MKTYKIKRLFVPALALVLVLTMCIIPINNRYDAAGENYLNNSGLEDSGSRQESYGNYAIPNGQQIQILKYWYGFNWTNPGVKNTLSQTTEARNGKYALRMDLTPGTQALRIYPSKDIFNSQIPAGYYELSFWVKSNNSNESTRVEVKTAESNVYSQQITKGESWHQIIIDGIYLNGTNGCLADYSPSGYTGGINLMFIFAADSTKSYVIIDDVCLKKSENLLANSSFENTEKLWNNSTGGYGNPGYKNKIVGNGQNNLLADGWYGFNWLNSAPKRIYTNHTIDAYDSKYALNVNIPSGSQSLTVYPKTDTVDRANITKGYYYLSVWVKSSNDSAKSVLELKKTDGTTYKTQITKSEKWHQVILDNVYLESLDDIADFQSGKHIKLIFAADSSGDETYITVDKIELRKMESWSNMDFENINGMSGWEANTTGTAVAKVVTGGLDNSKAFKASLPANNDTITLSEVTLPSDLDERGYYMLVFSAKGNGGLKVSLKHDEAGTDYTAMLSNEWQKFVVKDIPCSSAKIDSLVFYFTNGTNESAEILLDEISFYRQIGPGGFIDGLSANVTDGVLHLPEVSEGYKVEIAESDNDNIIATDGTVTSPETETIVNLTLRIINVNDSNDFAKAEPIAVSVKPFIVNLLPNSSFNEVNANDTVGYSNKTIISGQYNETVLNWRALLWNGVAFSTTHTTGQKSGDYALQVNVPINASSKGDKTVTIHPDYFSMDSFLPAGSYTMSITYKSNNTSDMDSFYIRESASDLKCIIDMPNTNGIWSTVSKNFTITEDLIYAKGTSDTRAANTSIAIKVNLNGTTEAQVIIDSISLVKN